MKTLPFTLFFLVPGGWSLHAQVVTAANFPVIGTEYTLNITPYVDPGAAGEDQTWDFSGLTVSFSFPFEVKDPAQVPFGNLFPEANLAIVQDVTADFYKVTANTFSAAGFANSISQVPYTDLKDELRVPLGFGDSYTDTYSWVYDDFGTLTYRSGTMTVTGDAAGDLIMPYGTVENVIRIKIEETNQDSLNVGGMPFVESFTVERYLWYKEGVRYPVVTFTETISGDPPMSSQSGIFLDATTVGVMDPVRSGLRFHLFPNPAHDQLTLDLELAEPENVQIGLMNWLGREVASIAEGQLTSGTHQLELDIEGLAPGMYVIRLMTDKGVSSRAVRIQ
jgi:hypothetical protein